MHLKDCCSQCILKDTHRETFSVATPNSQTAPFNPKNHSVFRFLGHHLLNIFPIKEGKNKKSQKGFHKDWSVLPSLCKKLLTALAFHSSFKKFRCFPRGLPSKQLQQNHTIWLWCNLSPCCLTIMTYFVVGKCVLVDMNLYKEKNTDKHFEFTIHI